MDDLYQILGLEDKTYTATDHDIKTAYRKLILVYHPDKLGDQISEKDKEIWLKIQKAYETLSDEQKRIAYDSQLPFDDTIPQQGDDIDDKNFYEVFEPVFVRTSRFSKHKPVPDLGSEECPIDEVLKFYKFWD